MTNLPRTFVSFSSTDKSRYDLMCAWKAHEHIDFNFADFQLDEDTTLYRGEGCEHCRKTGYRGRSGIYELMTMNEELAEQIIERAPAHKLVATARNDGMRLLREDGWHKVRRGMTTVDEVLSTTAV